MGTVETASCRREYCSARARIGIGAMPRLSGAKCGPAGFQCSVSCWQPPKLWQPEAWQPDLNATCEVDEIWVVSDERLFVIPTLGNLGFGGNVDEGQF